MPDNTTYLKPLDDPRHTFVVVWVLCLLLMVSCTHPSNQEPVSPYPSTVTPTIVMSATLSSRQETQEITKESVLKASTLAVNRVATPTSDIVPPQKEEFIPSCENYETPPHISSLVGVKGLIYYGNPDLHQWFVLTGTPAESTSIRLPNKKVDSFSISEDEKWLLAYSRVPASDNGVNQYPYYLVSRAGEVFEHKLDLTDMLASASQNIDPAIFHYWTLEWLTNGIIRVRISYGESPKPKQIFPPFVYGYYDIEQDSWLKDPIQSLPGRKSYGWVDLSPDLTRMLYLDKTSDFVLWDVENNKKLWTRFLGSDQMPPYATWSWNGQKVAFWTEWYPQNIQLLDREGNSYQVLQNPIYPDAAKEFWPYRGFFAWSPDSRYLAMSGYIDDGSTGLHTAMLYVYDVQKAEYIYRCPLGDTGKRTVSSNILWSPDGRYIVTKFLQSPTVPFRMYDLKELQVYQIKPAGFAAVDWVRNFLLQ